jgi:N-acetylneuraminic acid mutarotase
MAFAQYKIPYELGHDFGMGVDGPSSSPVAQVVTGPVTGVDGATGGYGEFHIVRITETADLESHLGIDASATYGVGLFSASARFKFAKDAKIQRNTLFMAVTATVTAGFRQIDAPTLTDEARTLIGNPTRFTEQYGDRFVRGIVEGGIFVGMLRVETDSHEEADTIALDLNGSYGLFSAEAKAKLDQVKRTHRTQVFTDVFRAGGPLGDSLEHPDDPVALYELLQRWLKSFDTNPAGATPISVTIAATTIASGPPPPNAADIAHAQDILVLCARARSQTLDRLNLVDYILENSSRFDFSASPREKILEVYKGCEIDLDTIAGAASATINDYKNVKSPVNYAAEKNLKYPCGILPEVMPTLKPVAMSASTGIWRVKSAMGGSGTVALVATADGVLYAMSDPQPHADRPASPGYVQKYDPAGNVWSGVATGAPMTGNAVLGSSGEIFLLGSGMVAYDPKKNSWRTCTALPGGRRGAHLAAGRNGKLYAIGGSADESGTYGGSVDEYDPARDAWVTKAPLPNIRFYFGVATGATGKIYVVGGMVRTGAVGQPNSVADVATVDEYDTALDQWTSRKAMPTARSSLMLAAGLNGRIYAIGGDAISWSPPPDNAPIYTPLLTVEEFDPSTNVWANVAPLNKARACAGVATLPDGTIVVAGGRSKPTWRADTFSDVEAFLP